MDGHDVTVVTPDQKMVEEIIELVDRASARRDHAALSEHKRMELHRLEGTLGHRPGEGSDPVLDLPGPAAMIVAHRHGRTVGYAHLSGNPATGDRSATEYALELVTDTADGSPVAGDAQPVVDDLLASALERVAGLGGGTVRLWVAEAGDVDDATAVAHGFRLERELIQMRCPLPVPAPIDPTTRPAAVLTTRSFRPGLDEEAWLATNNRAFAAHPEQGNWNLATLLEREQEPWFDPDGLLLFDYEGRLAGSCWTKIHHTAPPMGEIYVIGVDPDFQGRGWGRALTLAGLNWLAGRGLRLGMLYVDGDNRAAVSMYTSMGFTPDHVDKAYLREVDGIPDGTPAP
jgi:mycothiol synthase